MTKKKWRWLIAVLVIVAAAATWTARRAEACLFGSCDSIIIANQITQIAHMVTQIGKMVEQLSSLDGVLDTTTELVTSNDVGMGNIGRLREVTDAEWLIGRHGIGLSTSTSTGGVGAFLQRIPGITDEAGWLDVLAAPGLGDPSSATVLLAGRPATETSAAEPSAFRSWAGPAGPAWSNPGRDAAREAIDILGDVGEGTATWRTVWDDLEAALPPSVTAADLQGLRFARQVVDRIVRQWERAEMRAAAGLAHTHAVAEAASTLAVQVGESAAHLAELRGDDLMRTQRLDQAALANGVTQTELIAAQAQLAAYEAAREARERYEAERARREAAARWQADALRAEAEQTAFLAEVATASGRVVDSHRFVPSPSDW
ncbi:MAG: hypothetical protein F4018_08395 [Acidobacteria bacterium]|nr:hypothetical protein [Acidobacteriota bacterium]MYK88349.1 hypothetical protein [Acidobacteriota bacterium]